jgi:hypothetical protein
MIPALDRNVTKENPRNGGGYRSGGEGREKKPFDVFIEVKTDFPRCQGHP